MRIKKGSTDRSVYLKILNVDGTPKTDAVYNSAGLALWYHRDLAAVTDVTEVTLAAATTAHADGGFIHLRDGRYRLDAPDAAFATGAPGVRFGGTITGGIVVDYDVELVDYDPQDGVRFGLTALPNAAAGAAGGIPVSAAGGLSLDTMAAQLALVPRPIYTGVLVAVTNTTVEFAGGYGISTQAQIVVEIRTAGAHFGKSRFATYSGAGNIWTVDKAWNADSETTPTGTPTVDVFSVPANPVTNQPKVDVDKWKGATAPAMTGDAYARLGAPVGASIAADLAVIAAYVDELESRLTLARAGYLDKLNVSGNVASSGEVTAIQNNTRIVRVVPTVLERPDSGSIVYRIELYCYDAVGNMEAPDAAPTIGVVNESGTSRNGNLDSTTMTLVSTGRYRSTYTVAVGHAMEQLLFNFSVTEGGVAREYGNAALVVDTTAVDFTATDRTQLQAIYGKLPSKLYLAGTTNADGDVQLDEATGTPADAAGVGTLLSRLTAPRAAALDNLDATVSSRATPAQVTAALTSYDAPTKAELDAAIAALPASVVTAVFGTELAESYAGDGGMVTLAQGVYELLALLSELSKSGTTVTARKRDGSTTAFTLTLNDANNPTSITRAA